MSDIVRDAMHGITLLDAIGNRVEIPMEWCRTYSVCHATSVLGIIFLINIQMLEDMVRLYFNHQKPPGAAFVRRGDYRLVQGGVGDVVEPARWTYDVKPGHTVETSMILRKRDELFVRCPRCRTLFSGSAKNGWADWKVPQGGVPSSLLMYFAACLVQGDFKLKPGKQTRKAWYHQRGEPGHRALCCAENAELDDCSMSSTDGTAVPATEKRHWEDENEEDGREQFRLISVVDYIEVRYSLSYYDWMLIAQLLPASG
jgi:hypothetical protein